MNFTFLIPTINSYNHKNSKFNHQILVHSKNSKDETSNYLKSQSIYEMKSDKNYGLCTALNQLAQINLGDSRMIIIQPWDKNSIKDIEKSIYTSDLGVVPQSDGESIILNIPPLTEERRKQLAKGIGQKSEDARVSIRNIRRDIIGNIKTSEKNKDISEDISKRLLEKIEKVTGKVLGPGLFVP